MATISKGVTFADGDSVTHTKLNNLVDDATLSAIQQSDIVAGSGLVVTASTAPTDTNALWMDTGDSNALKYYNGSAWVKVGSTSFESVEFDSGDLEDGVLTVDHSLTSVYDCSIWDDSGYKVIPDIKINGTIVTADLSPFTVTGTWLANVIGA